MEIAPRSLAQVATVDAQPKPPGHDSLSRIHSQGLLGMAREVGSTTTEPLSLAKLIAIRLLGQHTGEETISLLESLLKDESTVVQSESLGRLYELDPKRVDNVAESFSQSPDVNVRTHCATAMLTVKSPERMARPAQMLDDVNPKLRCQVSAGLIELASDKDLRDSIIEYAMSMTKEDAWRGCEPATVVLAKLDHEPAGERFVQLLKAERPEVKVAAAWELTPLKLEPLCPAMVEHAHEVYEGFRSGRLTDNMRGAPLQVARLFTALGTLRYKEAEPDAIPSLELYTFPGAGQACGWAIEKLTGRKAPELAKLVYEETGWFLTPLT